MMQEHNMETPSGRAWDTWCENVFHAITTDSRFTEDRHYVSVE